MTINCVWEHNGNDTLLYAVNYIGAYTRGASLEIAKAKMPQEIGSYLKWLGEDTVDNIEVVIIGKKTPILLLRMRIPMYSLKAKEHPWGKTNMRS